MQAKVGFSETDIWGQIYEEVRQRFSAIADLAHGWEHVERVYRLALLIAEQEGAEQFIVGMAALMHDLGHAVSNVTDVTDVTLVTDVSLVTNGAGQKVKEHHADSSVKLARELLIRYGVPEAVQEAILHAIVAHSFSKGIEPRTLEARIVRDADRIDALGAIGIMRWAATGAVRFTQESCTYHPDDPMGKQHQLDDTRYALDHFALKLLKLQETMLTATGRALAQRRTAFMLAYLAEFEHELA